MESFVCQHSTIHSLVFVGGGGVGGEVDCLLVSALYDDECPVMWISTLESSTASLIICML